MLDLFQKCVTKKGNLSRLFLDNSVSTAYTEFHLPFGNFLFSGLELLFSIILDTNA